MFDTNEDIRAFAFDFLVHSGHFEAGTEYANDDEIGQGMDNLRWSLRNGKATPTQIDGADLVVIQHWGGEGQGEEYGNTFGIVKKGSPAAPQNDPEAFVAWWEANRLCEGSMFSISGYYTSYEGAEFGDAEYSSGDPHVAPSVVYP